MSVADEIYRALRDLFDKRVHDGLAPPRSARPYLTWQQVGGVPIVFLEQTLPGRHNARIQLNVWADDQRTAIDYALRAGDALVLWQPLQATKLSEPIAFPNDDELTIAGVHFDVSVWFTR